MWVISIHAPPRGATTLVLASRLATLFQFTPLREGRRTQQPLMWMKKLISIHAPPRGATARASSRQQKRQHFNSRPSARGDTAGRERRTADRISIHAPPRGATRVAGHRKVSNQISIHAPPRGATTRPKGAAARNCPISIHAPPRGATCWRLAALLAAGISIHAPPRGATTCQAHQWQCGNFNSRPSARGD